MRVSVLVRFGVFLALLAGFSAPVPSLAREAAARVKPEVAFVPIAYGDIRVSEDDCAHATEMVCPCDCGAALCAPTSSPAGAAPNGGGQGPAARFSPVFRIAVPDPLDRMAVAWSRAPDVRRPKLSVLFCSSRT